VIYTFPLLYCLQLPALFQYFRWHPVSWFSLGTFHGFFTQEAIVLLHSTWELLQCFLSTHRFISIVWNGSLCSSPFLQEERKNKRKTG
jgi:hypothetical protein